MDQDDYRSAVMACRVAAKMLAQHDLSGLLRAVDRADAVGPILDPTLWRDKHEAMAEDAELLRAALPLAELASRINDRHDVEDVLKDGWPDVRHD